MKRIKYYFKRTDLEICRPKSYFYDYMVQNNLTEMEVFVAIPEIIGGGIFWCKKHLFCSDDTKDTCGKSECCDYVPRNKISGVCLHHTHWLYTHGDKIILKNNSNEKNTKEKNERL